MNDDGVFRWFVVAAFVFLMVVALPFRIRSQKTGEPLDRRQEGLFILATLRPAAIVLWSSVFAYMVNPPWMTWSSVAAMPSGSRNCPWVAAPAITPTPSSVGSNSGTSMRPSAGKRAGGSRRTI